MKMHGRWVAWMAALALAAMLAATPREGAAGPRPYLMPTDPPGPVLGEPDVPGDSSVPSRDGVLIQIGRFLLWVRVAPTPSIVIVGREKADVPSRAGRTPR
jgi:hypothetical protein